MTILDHVNKSYKISHDNGFWEKPMTELQSIALIVSEASESLEAHRERRFANIEAFESNMNNELHPGTGESMTAMKWFERQVKDTLEDELADVFIRICVHIGGFKMIDKFSDYEIYNNPEYKFLDMTIPRLIALYHPQKTKEWTGNGDNNDFSNPDNWEKGYTIPPKEEIHFPDKIFYLMKYLINIDENPLRNIVNSVTAVCELAYKMNIDLEKHVSHKCNYNISRGYKHGKDY